MRTFFNIGSRYYKRVGQIAGPLIVGNAGQAVVVLADNIMVGQLGALPLAGVAFSGIMVSNFMVLGMGIAAGLTPLVGENFIRRGYAKCSQLLQNSLLLNTLIGILIIGLLFAIHPLLSHMGQDPRVIEIGKGYYYIMTLSVLPYMLFLSFKQFMDGVGNTKVTMAITIAGNVTNIVLNYAFIYGKLGAPALGAFGAGLATFISRLIMPVIYYIWIRRNIIYGKYLKFFSYKRFSVSINRNLIVLGMPIAWQMIVEILALSVTVVMFGWIGVEAQAAGQISMSLVHIIFLVASGLSAATTIVVSHEYGRRNRREIVKYTKASMAITVTIMTVIGLLLSAFARPVVSAFTSDVAVIPIAVVMIYAISFMEIFDGLQVTVLGALRGMKEVNKPMRIALLSYLLISLPMGYVGGFMSGLGAPGVWLGFLSGLIVAFILFLRHFYRVIKKPVF